MFATIEMYLENSIGRVRRTATIDIKEIETFILDQLEERVPEPGFTRIYGNYGHYVAETELSFAIGCTLYANVEAAGTRKDSDGNEVEIYTLAFEINWSGTSRSVRDARQSAQLYLEMCNVADRLETILSRFTIVKTS